jgi:hypothetical protein
VGTRRASDWTDSQFYRGVWWNPDLGFKRWTYGHHPTYEYQYPSGYLQLHGGTGNVPLDDEIWDQRRELIRVASGLAPSWAWQQPAALRYWAGTYWYPSSTSSRASYLAWWDMRDAYRKVFECVDIGHYRSEAKSRETRQEIQLYKDRRVLASSSNSLALGWRGAAQKVYRSRWIEKSAIEEWNTFKTEFGTQFTLPLDRELTFHKCYFVFFPDPIIWDKREWHVEIVWCHGSDVVHVEKVDFGLEAGGDYLCRTKSRWTLYTAPAQKMCRDALFVGTYPVRPVSLWCTAESVRVDVFSTWRYRQTELPPYSIYDGPLGYNVWLGIHSANLAF